MAIRWDKLTVKTQEAFQRANDLASEHGNPEVMPVHLLAALLETASQAILMIDRAGRMVLANRRACEMFGYTTQELLGAGIELLVPESKRAAHSRRREDYMERPRFTQPEIQRANLADVILRMKVSGLGDIERFPFINAPPAKAVRAGYQLLEELGAIVFAEVGAAAESEPDFGVASGPAEAGPSESLDNTPTATVKEWQLTPVGRELARLPVDPTVGRMILQASTEKCLREVLIIASGLSIQDPRERPLDKQMQADAAHRRFAHPDSDFLTLLKIWETFHDEFESMSQGRMRRFCHDHFLSYIRMREWRDVHDQLLEVLEERENFRITSIRDGLTENAKSQGARTKDGGPSAKSQASGARHREPDPKSLDFGTPAYRAIHRSVLAGLLGNIAMWDEQNGQYKAAHDRKVAMFPGSALYVRPEAKKKDRSAPATPAGGSCTTSTCVVGAVRGTIR